MITIADAHVEFIHDPADEANLPDPAFTHNQINPDQINQIKPDLLFLACWVEPQGEIRTKIDRIIDRYLQVIEKNQWTLVLTAEDLKKPGVKVMLHLEDAAGLSNPAELSSLAAKGVRSVGLTHNKANQYAGGSLTDSGLTDLGVEMIRTISDLGCLLDWAHLSNQAAIEVADLHPALPPFISHCGLKGVWPAERNVSDNLLNLIRERDGWVGLGLARSFLTDQDPTLEHFGQQIEYASKKCGPSRVGIGSDLGGIISGTPKGLDSYADIHQLASILVEPEQLGQNLLSFLPRYFKAMSDLKTT